MPGINDNDLSSDYDFDDTKKITRKRGKIIISTIAEHNNLFIQRVQVTTMKHTP